MIQGVLLAAGQSKRFGRNKLLHPLPDGTPIAVAAARHMLAAIPHCLAVVRPGQTQLTTELTQLGCRVIVNEAAKQGMGSSLACAVQASRQASGWVVALADMPCIPPHIIRHVAAQITTEDVICAPQYQQQRGHPVGFGAAYAAVLCALKQDNGARKIIQRHQALLKILCVDDRGVILDIDEEGDLLGLNQIEDKRR